VFLQEKTQKIIFGTRFSFFRLKVALRFGCPRLTYSTD